MLSLPTYHASSSSLGIYNFVDAIIAFVPHNSMAPTIAMLRGTFGISRGTSMPITLSCIMGYSSLASVTTRL